MSKPNISFWDFLNEVKDDLEQARAKFAAYLVIGLVVIVMIGVNIWAFKFNQKDNAQAIQCFVISLDVTLIISSIFSLWFTWWAWRRREIAKYEEECDRI